MACCVAGALVMTCCGGTPGDICVRCACMAAAEEGGGTGPRGLLGGGARCWICTLLGVDIIGLVE